MLVLLLLLSALGAQLAVLGLSSVVGVVFGTFAVIATLVLIGGGFYAGSLAYQARKVLKAGHTLEDARLALRQDVTRRHEEVRFEFGDRGATLDRVATAVGVIGLVGGIGALGAGLIFGAPTFLEGLGVLGVYSGLGAAVFKSVRSRRRADVAGRRLLKIWGGRIGSWLFKLGGLGLRDAAPAGIGAYRPTEVAIGLAANKLFEDLPKETRRELAGLPDTVQKLEEDVRALRVQVKELNSVLAEIGDDPTAPDGEAREKIRADVEATRDAAAARLRDVVTALEQVRLGLIRIHAGEQVLPNVTMELKAAKDLSEDMSNLLEGHREVERLLAERRATGMFTIAEG